MTSASAKPCAMSPRWLIAGPRTLPLSGRLAAAGNPKGGRRVPCRCAYVDRRRRPLARLVEVDNKRQRLIVDADQMQRFLGGRH